MHLGILPLNGINIDMVGESIQKNMNAIVMIVSFLHMDKQLFRECLN